MKIRKPTAQELEHWEGVLAHEGLSMQRGFQPNFVIYVENTEKYQTTKTRTGARGGRVRRYKLGERTNSSGCAVCGKLLFGKRKHTRTCSMACRKRLSRNVKRHTSALRSEEQN
jgi:hypothetical protein